MPAGRERGRRRSQATLSCTNSNLERAPAAAALDNVGVVEDEAPLLETVIVIDDSPIEIRVELLVDGHADAVDLDDAVPLGSRGVEPQAIGKTAATPSLDTHAQDRAIGEVLSVMIFFTSLAAFSVNVTPID